MIKINTYPKAIAVFFVTLILLAYLLSGCYPVSKAVKQMEKGIQRYEDTARGIFRGKFPCITTGYDSSEFLQSIKTMDSLLVITIRDLRINKERVRIVRDSIRHALKGDDCPELLNQAADHIASLQVDGEGLKDDTARLRADLQKVKAAFAGIKPVIREIKDSSEIKDALVLRDKAAAEAATWKAKYEADHEWRTAREAKDKGKIIIRIPWWWLLIAGLLIGGGTILYFKKLNPLNKL